MSKIGFQSKADLDGLWRYVRGVRTTVVCIWALWLLMPCEDDLVAGLVDRCFTPPCFFGIYLPAEAFDYQAVKTFRPLEPHMENCTHPTGSQPAKDVCLLTPATALLMSLPQRQSIDRSTHNPERTRNPPSDWGTRVK
ncbi:uncharacterized protein BO66DRAFT_14051 [Aspergillus aculeatinus CBS 121060]|uniref:Uncharacterized protein n=1 Tax=Aspergillus aculeatinus CBS 121060 TaxID=1448322 RepID=A0ACD1HPY8_9EURO|nr:hypothetical protein BO66DRAFT_14051 [Aspergillus aculeatinus CBS 121060]RAH75674.1 hypothetical protein BO66DRAFT_14051 [Aspergillus aculeatinus CBS 121060]